MNKQKKGISLIVLVITIIVMLILASAIIITLSNTNIITKAREAVLKTDVKNFDQELSLTLADKKLEDSSFNMQDVNAATLADIQKYIPSFTEDYYGKLIIKDGKLTYVTGNVTEEEKATFEDLNLGSGNYITPAKAEEIKTKAENASVDTTVSSTEVATYVTDIPEEYAYLFAIHEGNLYYRYEKATYDERVSLHSAGIPYLIGDVNEDGLISVEDTELITYFEVFLLEDDTNNLYYIGDVTNDYWIDSVDCSALEESLISTQENAAKYTDFIDLTEQIPAKIKLLGAYRKVDYNFKIIETENTNDYTEIMKRSSKITKEEAKRFSIVDGNAVYRYETLTTEEFAWVAEYELNFNLGDGNFDGLVDDKDLEILNNIVLGEAATEKQQAVLDINGDGTVNSEDQTSLSAYLSGTERYYTLLSNYYTAKKAS